MPSAGTQRIITVDSMIAVNEAQYVLAAGEYLLVETVVFRVDFEPPLILQGRVAYSDPATDRFGRYSTPWFPANRPVVADFVIFSFGRGLDSMPLDIPRTTDVAAAESLYDPNNVMCPLPDVPLSDGQIVSVVANARNPDGTEADVNMSEIVIVVTDLTDEFGTGVIPPYTALPFAEQVSAVA